MTDIDDDQRAALLAPYLVLITSEHNERPKFRAALEAAVAPHLDIGAQMLRFSDSYDIDTAIGTQLDTLGEWIGVSRFVTIPIENVYFSWDTEKVGWDNGIWYIPFQPTTTVSRLDDDHYRIVLRARIVANYWDGTVPGAYAAWGTVFGPEGYHIIIQDGMAAASHYLIWDDIASNGWDHSSWLPYAPARANFVRNSALAGAMLGVPGVLPTHWSATTDLSIDVLSIEDKPGQDTPVKIDTADLRFYGTTASTQSILYFEDISPDHLTAQADQIWTLSVYFQELDADPAITHTELFIEARRASGATTEFLLPLDNEPGLFLRRWLSMVAPPLTATLRVGLRLTHASGAVVAGYRIVVGQPQIEIGVSQPTSVIRTTGEALTAYDPIDPIPRVNGGMHIIYGLIAPYSPPPAPLNFFSFDQFTSATTEGAWTNQRRYGIPQVVHGAFGQASLSGSGHLSANMTVI